MDFDLLDVKNLVATFDRGPTGDPFVDGRYQTQIDETGNPRPYYRMFWHLCNQFKPDLAVELGSYQASCAAHMASGGAGTVATIDHHSDRIGEPGGDDYNQRLAEEAAQAYANLFYIKGWTTDEDVITEVRSFGKPIDLLFIDSWHHIDYARADWKAYEPLLADTALVVCDDLANAEPTLHMMVEWWEEVSKDRESFLSGTAISTYPMGFFKYAR
jgi:cephalosporin hydroxylase